MLLIMFKCVSVCVFLPRSLTSSPPLYRVCQGIMQPSGHRLRDIEHHPLLTDNDNYDSASSSSSEADMADRVWFIRDGCGMVCAVMTWLLVVYADFVVTFVMLLPSKDFWYSVVNGVIFNCLAVLALSSHLRTMLTDPVSTQRLGLDVVKEQLTALIQICCKHEECVGLISGADSYCFRVEAVLYFSSSVPDAMKAQFGASRARTAASQKFDTPFLWSLQSQGKWLGPL